MVHFITTTSAVERRRMALEGCLHCRTAQTAERGWAGKGAGSRTPRTRVWLGIREFHWSVLRFVVVAVALPGSKHVRVHSLHALILALLCHRSGRKQTRTTVRGLPCVRCEGEAGRGHRHSSSSDISKLPLVLVSNPWQVRRMNKKSKV